ncbi:MAG: hypothetical protein LBS56_09440 [Propionibacteriaceae bacterium]|jgi:hypothetical protein|nr:hypothetical protein [Propionibacteriaceae bacterium]
MYTAGWLTRALRENRLGATGDLQLLRDFPEVPSDAGHFDVDDGEHQLGAVIIAPPDPATTGGGSYTLVHVAPDGHPVLVPSQPDRPPVELDELAADDLPIFTRDQTSPIDAIVHTGCFVDLRVMCHGVRAGTHEKPGIVPISDHTGVFSAIEFVGPVANRAARALQPGACYDVIALWVVAPISLMAQSMHPRLFATHATRFVQCAPPDEFVEVAPRLVRCRAELSQVRLRRRVSMTLLVITPRQDGASGPAPDRVVVGCSDLDGNGVHVVIGEDDPLQSVTLRERCIYDFDCFRVTCRVSNPVLASCVGSTITEQDPGTATAVRFFAAYASAHAAGHFSYYESIPEARPDASLMRIYDLSRRPPLAGRVVGFRAIVTATDVGEAYGPRSVVVNVSDAHTHFVVLVVQRAWAAGLSLDPGAHLGVVAARLEAQPIDFWVHISWPVYWDQPLPALMIRPRAADPEWSALRRRLYETGAPTANPFEAPTSIA